MGKPVLFILFIFLFLTAVVHASDSFELEESIVVYGEYPVEEELGEGRFTGREPQTQPLIDYSKGKNVQERAFIEALHFLNANVYGYSFYYQPGSMLLETEELFTLTLKGELDTEGVQPIAEGVRGNVYRVKVEFRVSPSMRKWLTAFTSNTLRLEDAEGTSDFYAGWDGRSDAFREALRNLVLVTAKKRLSSKPLIMAGDILLKGNPTFAVGAGRYYCRVEGYVNIVELVTYD
jgi:hypothetical protein